MFVIKPSSAKAKKLKVYLKFGDKPPLGAKISKRLPFQAMAIGQSFFMQYRECSRPEFVMIKERVARYNRTYAVYFALIEHNDEPKRLEVARIA